MNILVQGVGGIGGIVAARLTAAGLRVTPVTNNPAIADALNTRGFQLEETEGAVRTIPLTVPATPTLPRDSGPFDLILVTTPPVALEEAIQASSPLLAPDGRVLCFQNGLPEQRAARVVGEERVVGCVVGWGASMPEPGRYAQTSAGGFQVGRLDGSQDAGLERVVALLDQVAPTTLTTNLPGVRWSKLAINCAITTLGAIGGDRLGVLLRHRFVRRLCLEIFSEVVAVARAEGVRLEKVSGTLDLESLALSGEEQAMTSIGSPSLFFKHSVLLAVGMKFRRMRSSMLYALERGRRPGVEHLNGEIVSRAEQHRLEAPVNAHLVEVIQEIARGERSSSLEQLRSIYQALRDSRTRRLAA